MPDAQPVSTGSILDAIRETERDGLLTDRRAEGLSGLSGARTVGLLQRLAKLFEDVPGSCYLEVGVFQGLTLVSTALEAPGLPCFGIDNFATLDPGGENKAIVDSRISGFGAENAHLINDDFEAALETLGDHIGDRKVGIYLVDGPHDYRSQLICLTLVQPFLHENAVIIIDDANYPDVRWSTRDFLLGFPEYKLAFDSYSTDHPANLIAAEKKKFEETWLNGVHVLVRDKGDELGSMIPPTTDRERTLYLNEWLVHRLRLAELAPDALALADAVVSGDAAAEEMLRDRLIAAHSVDRDVYNSRQPDRNVYSEALPQSRYNPTGI
jgi:hypothetical protein